MAKAFRQDGVDGSEKMLEAALKPLKAATLDDLYVAVGNGNTGPKDVVHAAYPELRQTPRAPRMIPQLPARAPSRPARRGSHADQRPAAGHGGEAMPAAAIRCPATAIVGIVTTGKGVTIHTQSCQTLESFAATPGAVHRRRLGGDGQPRRRAHRPDQRDRHATSRHPGQPDQRVSKHEGAVTNLKIVNRQQDFFEILVDVEVRDLRHLSTVIAGLRAASGITQVERRAGERARMIIGTRRRPVRHPPHRAGDGAVRRPLPAARVHRGRAARAARRHARIQPGTYAKRFAAKEACAKALGTGFRARRVPLRHGGA